MLERVENLTNEIIEYRKKVFGKTFGIWVCDNCKKEETSFLYNYEFHILEICSKCNQGKMIEDESKREKPFRLLMGGGKQAEDQWLAKQSPLKAASVLLGDDPDY